MNSISENTTTPTSQTPADAIAQAPSQVGPGRKLKQAREANGKTITEVAEKLKLTESLVKAMEHDNYENAPNNVFIKGYLRAYAKLLGISGDELVSQFDTLKIAEKKGEVTASFDFSQNSHKSNDKVVVWVTAFVVIGIFLLVFLWWRGQRHWSQLSSLKNFTSSLMTPAQDQSNSQANNNHVDNKQVMQNVLPAKLGVSLGSAPMVVNKQNLAGQADNNASQAVAYGNSNNATKAANPPSEAEATTDATIDTATDAAATTNADDDFGDNSQSATTNTRTKSRNSRSVQLSPPF